MSSPSISTDKAKQDKLFYVVANLVIVHRSEKACLLLKRSGREKVLPDKWAFPGGKLEHGDVSSLLDESGAEPIDGIPNILGKLAEREAKEECGLDVDAESAAIVANKVFVRPDGVPVFMVTLSATYSGGTVVLEDQAFSDSAWVRREELGSYDCIDGVRKEAEAALNLLASS